MGPASVIFLSMFVCLSLQRRSKHFSSSPQQPPITQNFYCSTYLSKMTPPYFTWDRQVCGLSWWGLPRSYKNAEQACNADQIVGFRALSCEDITEQCTKNYRLKYCKDIDKKPLAKACSLEKGQYPKNITTKQCCTGDSFISWLEGPCPVPHRVSCKLWPKDEECPNYESTACGIEKGGRRKNYYNACRACKDPKVKEYYFGGCLDQ